MRLLGRITNKVLALLFNLIEPKIKPIEPATPQLVAKRFRQLFIEHGVEETRIPRIFPKVSLEDLQSDNLLIKKLTPELINDVAELFKVRSEWLEGVDNTIYHYQTCYKQPRELFEFLNTIKFGESDFPFRVITPVKKFDNKDDMHQPFSILFVEKIAEIGDHDVDRYYLDAGWAWNHSTCRIQLKVMALLYWKHIKQPITIYTLPPDIYFEIENLQKIPYQYLTGSLVSDPSVEDYISDPKDSAVAKEFDELVDVYQYIEEHKLREIRVYSSIVNDELSENNHKEASNPFQKAISEMNSRNAKAKYKDLDKIKKDFIYFYYSKNYTSRRGAARLFFATLSNIERIQLVPTYDERYLEESTDKAVRTLTTALRGYKLD